jgi:AcrR family transcriptional regulator
VIGDNGATRRNSLREEQKRLTRSKLLESALEVFTEKGYSRATIDDIVTGAGASRGTFYLYFPAKAAVIVELIESGWVAQLTAVLDDLRTMDAASEKDVEAWLGRFIGTYRRHAPTLRAWAQATTEEHPLLSQTDEFIRMMIEAATVAIEKAPSRVRQPKRASQAEIMAMALVFELERVCFYKFVRRWDVPDSIQQVLATRWHAALGG